ncbi:hypothetical protein [Novosphingobium soli]|uniref:Uncharacterized protein n=1 Tax=Novosphingobium soli TaxID=574956 RepID=A0ABV6CQX7_9SPHN
MNTVLLMLAAGAWTLSAASPVEPVAKKETDRRKCRYVVQPASEAAAPSTITPDGEALLLSAVDRRVNGCAVLVLASGREIAPPAPSSGPAARRPAQLASGLRAAR